MNYFPARSEIRCHIINVLLKCKKLVHNYILLNSFYVIYISYYNISNYLLIEQLVENNASKNWQKKNNPQKRVLINSHLL